MDDDLVAWGRVARLETLGRVTGKPRSVAVGFIERPDGSLLVAAGTATTDWALNLLADPACRVTIGERTWHAVAGLLEGPDHAAAIRDLIMRYGTPAEGLGAGPAFSIERRAVTEPRLGVGRPARRGRTGPGQGAIRRTPRGGPGP